jgi:aminoglycoside 6-adenylyltransferase
MLLVDDVDFYINQDEWLSELGNCHISFFEYTVAGGKERRVILDDALDVDFLFLHANDLAQIESDRNVREIVQKSYRVLFDKIGFAAALQRMTAAPEPRALPSEADFRNEASTFLFHCIWAAKKIQRGELWVARNCVDGYMKQLFLNMAEIHARALHGLSKDTWHNGRFIEQWAEPWIVEGFPRIFAAYSRADLLRALSATLELYRLMAVEAASLMGYAYPQEAEGYASDYLRRILKNMD